MSLPPVDQLIQDVVIAVVTAVLGFFFGHKHGKKSNNVNSNEEKK